MSGTSKFPLGGPAKSCLNAAAHLPRLFQGCHVFLFGAFPVPFEDRQQLASVLRAGGAVVLGREPNPESIPEEEHVVPYHARKGSALGRCSHFIVYGTKEPAMRYDMPHVKTLPLEWLLRSISSFTLADPK